MPRTSLQVLPVEDGGCDWPSMLGRVLFGFFGGPDPIIRHVQVDASHDQLSEDVVECWATYFWAVQACMHAPSSPAARAELAKFLPPIAEKVYRLVGLQPGELMAGEVMTLMARLSQRFSKPLGLVDKDIASGHLALTRRLKQPNKRTAAE